jgi:OmpA-OmpF porin, OOP family
MNGMHCHRWLLGVLSLSSLTLAVGVSAQSAPDQGGAALMHFEPTLPGDRYQAVPEATLNEKQKFWVGIQSDYAFKPRAIRSSGESNNLLDAAQIYAHLDAAYTVIPRATVFINLPFRMSSSAVSGESGGFGMADTRLGVRGQILGKRDEIWALGAGVTMWAPTGSEDKLTGDGRARVLLRGIVSGKVDKIRYTSYLGYLARKKANVGLLSIGPSIAFGGGFSVPIAGSNYEIGSELYGLVALPGEDLKTSFSRSVPVEASVNGRAIWKRHVFGLFVGTGLTPTPGTATFRMGINYATIANLKKSPKEFDRDHDGIYDAVDACIEVAGVPSTDPKTHGCPPPEDSDGDGIPDTIDACPKDGGVRSANGKRNGCPMDTDQDGISDLQDACPFKAGIADKDPKKHGCPPDPDSDGDGILDKVDACVSEAGKANTDPQKHGCPERDTDGDGILDNVDACVNEPGIPNADAAKHGCPLAKLCGPNQNEICITQPVLFATASAKIIGNSSDILKQVAEILKDNPDIELVSVEGHTDNQGTIWGNRTLSKARAEAVKAWLIKDGFIDSSRLVSKGFGQDKPITENKTKEGRAKNRRVEFIVLKRHSSKVIKSNKSDGLHPHTDADPNPPSKTRLQRH